ncbi:hypothetical protein SAY86_011676 [Trapa natans]|uniref:Uncharacterized protein n=1 Tax=Trapa natans TaxID=22666 RepID=A0AAN7LGT8_TRANT|nr:hypothetical protein SAY86_011676 [Trapa natans]
MDFFSPNKSLALLQLLLLVSISNCFFPVPTAHSETLSLPFLSRPSHKPPVHPPVYAPAKPPVHPPVHPPVKPPVHHPVHPPVKPPVHPPVKPPAHPPVHPPVKPPVHPPVKPPVHPPVKPPVHPPVKPPVYPPVHPPVKPPVHPPIKPPVHPPVKPPVHPPVSPPLRSYIIVNGLVYCKSCKYKGKNSLGGATPIQGAVVQLVCKNTKKKLVQTAKTNQNGYFILTAPKTISSYAYSKCTVTLVSSPLSSCNKPSILNGGKSGALLKPRKSFEINKVPYTLYSVGPFAFEPTCPSL